MRFYRLLLVAPAVMAISCQDHPTALPQFSISDAVHGSAGNAHFYFLPPLVPNPSPTGTFDGSQSPVVEICEWAEGCVGDPLVTFTTGTSGGFIQVDPVAESYGVAWHAGDYALDVDAVYRIRVFVGAQQLGHADVQPVTNGGELKNLDTDEYIGLVQNRTLMIQFRIEEGALGITVDATALTATSFVLGGVGWFPTDEVVSLNLDPGVYVLSDPSGGSIRFEIMASGEVAYAPELEPFLDGLGSAQLTVVGYDIGIDATAMTAKFSIGNIGYFEPTTPITITVLPGNKVIGDISGGTHRFEVTIDGEIAYAPELEPFLDGLGSAELTVVGHEIAVNAMDLVSPTFAIVNIGTYSTSAPRHFVLLPGLKHFSSSDLTFAFVVNLEGLLDYETSLDPRVLGRGTRTLVVK